MELRFQESRGKKCQEKLRTKDGVLFKVRVYRRGVTNVLTYQSLWPSELYGAATGCRELLFTATVIGSPAGVQKVRGEIVGRQQRSTRKKKWMLRNLNSLALAPLFHGQDNKEKRLLCRQQKIWMQPDGEMAAYSLERRICGSLINHDSSGRFSALRLSANILAPSLPSFFFSFYAHTTEGWQLKQC